MPTVTLTPAEYWQLRSLQERIAHARTLAQLQELRALQAHTDHWTGLVSRYPELGASDAWTFADADCTLTTQTHGGAVGDRNPS